MSTCRKSTDTLVGVALASGINPIMRGTASAARAKRRCPWLIVEGGALVAWFVESVRVCMDVVSVVFLLELEVGDTPVLPYENNISSCHRRQFAQGRLSGGRNRQMGRVAIVVVQVRNRTDHG